MIKRDTRYGFCPTQNKESFIRVQRIQNSTLEDACKTYVDGLIECDYIKAGNTCAFVQRCPLE